MTPLEIPAGTRVGKIEILVLLPENYFSFNGVKPELWTTPLAGAISRAMEQHAKEWDEEIKGFAIFADGKYYRSVGYAPHTREWFQSLYESTKL